MTKAKVLSMPIAIATGVLVLLSRPVEAGPPRPVHFEVVGCVEGGRFTSERHRYGVQSRSGESLDWKDADLHAYEGKTIRIMGTLRPADYLSMKELVVVDNRCREELHRSRFPPWRGG